MKIDISSAITELLYEHKSVVLPGLGAFTSSYKSATIDYVQGSVVPPSKDLDFNSNLMMNDGILVNFVQKKYDISVEQAEKAIETFVKEIKDTLDKKEMVVFPQVGKIYRDYEGTIKFLAEKTNFNADAHGLPEISFFPILRERKTKEKSAVAAQTRVKESKGRNENSDSKLPAWMKILLPILGILSIVVLSFSIYYLSKGDDLKSNDTPIASEERVNQKPSDPNFEDDPEDAIDFADDENEDLDDRPIDSEAPTIGPNQKEAFIVVHSFGNKSNVEKFMKQLISDGFQPKSLKDGKLTRVGIIKLYETEEELKEAVSDLKKLYNTTPKLWDDL